MYDVLVQISLIVIGNETLFTVSLRLLVLTVDVLGHLPDLHDVVRSHAADQPGLVFVPTEV